MARAAALFCALWLSACPANPYVLGRVADGGPSRDAGEGGTGLAEDACPAEHPEALVCSGFEPPELSAEWSDQASARAGEIERVGTRVRTGAGALRATSAGPDSYALVAADFAALRSGDLYVRAYSYVPAGLATEIMNIMFVGDGDPIEGFHGIDLNLQDGALQMFSPQSPQRHTDSAQIPRGRWFCLRLHVVIDDQRGFVQAFVDDRQALMSGSFDTLPDEGINQLRLGIDWSSEQAEPFEVFFDDVIVDTVEVACR